MKHSLRTTEIAMIMVRPTPISSHCMNSLGPSNGVASKRLFHYQGWDNISHTCELRVSLSETSFEQLFFKSCTTICLRKFLIRTTMNMCWEGITWLLIGWLFESISLLISLLNSISLNLQHVGTPCFINLITAYWLFRSICGYRN